MSDCATPTVHYETPTPLALQAAFDGGRITSEGGLLWLARVDSELGLCQAISERVPARECAHQTLLPPNSRSPLLTLSEAAGEGWRSAESTCGL